MNLRRFNIPGSVLQIIVGVLLVMATWLLPVSAGTNNLIVLETGSGNPLLSVDYQLSIPEYSLLPRLSFEFGFATSERIDPATFLDSFSITIEDNKSSTNALLLTADAYGVQWAPTNAGGLIVDPSSFSYQASAFPDLASSLTYRYAFSMYWFVPESLAGQFATLYFDLFDNQNNLASLAFVKSIQITNGAPSQLPPWPLVQSAASPAGPFADEVGVAVNTNNMSVVVGKYGPNRFYRIRSNVPTYIKQYNLKGNLLFTYEFPGVAVVLQSAVKVEGPYQDETNSIVDATARLIRFPRPVANRFYRIRSTVPATILPHVLSQKEWVIYYEFRPKVLELESSAQAVGPYASEGIAVFDRKKQTISLAQTQSVRFYRVRPDSPYRFTQVKSQGIELVMSYERRSP